MLRTVGKNEWEYGYEPNVRKFTGEFQLIHDYGFRACLGGHVREVSVLCPYCSDKALPCPSCNGSGKLKELSADEKFNALASAVEASDDPDSILLNGL